MEELCQRISSDVVVGKRVTIRSFVNLYGCTIGDDTMVGTFVEIQCGASIGARCKISSHSFIPEGVTIEDDVFIGHGVMFVNDNRPRATGRSGRPSRREDWEDRFVRTHVCRGASIGSGATILGGITVGTGALIGAGSVVTKDVPPNTTVAGNPARILRENE